MQKITMTLSTLVLIMFFFIQPVVVQAGKVAARVNGDEITLSEINMAVKGLSQYRELQSFVLENLIVSTLIYQESVKAGTKIKPGEVEKGFKEYTKIFPDDATIERELKRFDITREELKQEITKKLMVSRFIEKRAAEKNINVTEEEARAYYNAQPDAFNLPERIRASHILLTCGPAEPVEKAEKIKKQILDIRKRIVAGEFFSDLAKEYSDDPSKVKGGDIGVIGRKNSPDKEFTNAAFALNVGEISGPIKTVLGYHLITVTEKKAAMKISFDEIKDRITNELLKQKNDNALKSYVKKLSKKSNIEILLNRKK